MIIPTSATFEMHGALYTRKKHGNQHLLILVHGLYGSYHDILFKKAISFFTKHGFDIFSFNFYDSSRKTRKVFNTTLSEYSKDFKKVINFFGKSTYKKTSIIAHSLGSFPILFANISNINRIVLWEPSQEPLQIVLQEPMSKRVIRDAKKMETIAVLVKKMKSPLKIITAERAGKNIGKNLYYNNANKPRSFFCVAGADHNFTSVKNKKILFQETLKWLQ